LAQDYVKHADKQMIFCLGHCSSPGGTGQSFVAAPSAGGPCSVMAAGEETRVPDPKTDATERVPPKRRATVPRGRPMEGHALSWPRVADAVVANAKP